VTAWEKHKPQGNGRDSVSAKAPLYDGCGRLWTGRKQGHGAALSVEPALQNEGGGKLVDETTAGLAANSAIGRMVACRFERCVGLGGGKALVPEVNGEAGMASIGDVFVCVGRCFGDERLQLIHKAMDPLGLGAAVSREVERIADDNAGATVAACKAEDGTQVAAGLRTLNGEQRLREAQGIGECDADAARADIEA
jgi:hypothetical protein